MFIYYVYAYLREDGTPYYIGKGKGNRAFSKRHTVNLPICKSRIVFLEKNLSNIGDCALERRYIEWYGRKVDSSGILRNITLGGEENHSKLLTGRKAINFNRPDYSYRKTDEYRKNMSLSVREAISKHYREKQVCKFCDITYSKAKIDIHETRCKSRPENLKICVICAEQFTTKHDANTCSPKCLSKLRVMIRHSQLNVLDGSN